MDYYIDAHTHISALTVENFAAMHLAGIRTVVSPVQLGCGRALQPETIVDVWHAQFEKHFKRCRQMFINPYAMIGISMVATPAHGLDRLYPVLEEFIAREDVLAVGEIGFEPGSATNADHDYQKELLRVQIAIAKKFNKVVNIHTPNASIKKIAATEETLALCAEVGIDMDRVVVDHCSIDNIEKVLSAGAYAAISVQPWRNIAPELAADWILKYPSDHIIVDSDSSELISDPLAVAKTAAALRKKSAPEALVTAACGGNAKKAYSIPD